MGPEDWPAWHAYRQDGWRNERATPPGRARHRHDGARRRRARRADRDARSTSARRFHGGLGQVVVRRAPGLHHEGGAGTRRSARGCRRRASASTRSPTARRSSPGRATSPTAGRSATSSCRLADAAAARSGASGLARLALGDGPAPLLVARRGQRRRDPPVADRLVDRGRGLAADARGTDTLRFFVFDDREMYRPGEKVHVKGWLRRIGAGPARRRRGAPRRASAASPGRCATRRATRSPRARRRVERPRRLRPRAQPAARR